MARDALRDVVMLLPGGLPANLYEVHEQVYRMLCGADGARHFLYAPEADPAPTVLVRSRSLPPALAASATEVELPSVGVRRLFRLTASPAVSRDGHRNKLPPGSRGARVRWLAERGAADGFELVGEPEVLWWQTVFTRKGEIIRRETVLFQGELRVIDAPAMARVLETGIGRSRGLGYGLLRLFAPPDTSREGRTAHV